MAQLHGRVRGVQDRHLNLLFLFAGVVVGLLATLAFAPSVRAQDGATTRAELDRAAEALGSEHAGVRAEGIAFLLGLEEEALPAIRERVSAIVHRQHDPEESYKSLNSFRHAVGSLRADDREVDVVPGVGLVLANDRSPVTVAMAERLLLARVLSEMGTLDVVEPLGELLGADAHAWRWEQKRIVWRMGPRALPLLVVMTSHRSPDARRFARWGIRELDLGDAGRAVQQSDMGLVASLLRAWGTVRDMDAMSVVVTFVTHERGEVRAAARWATDRYGQNAVWQLRRVYRNLTGERAPTEWNAARTAEALYAAYDERRWAPVREDLEAGLVAVARGDLDAARAKLDDVLARAPELPRRAEMAPGYAALAARAQASGDADEAVRLYRRAVRLASDSPSAQAWRAELRYIEAESRLRAGVADLGAYEAVLALAPTHEGATRFVREVSPSVTRADDAWLTPRRVLLALGALVLALAIGVLLFRASPEALAEGDSHLSDEAGARGEAEDTLPG